MKYIEIQETPKSVEAIRIDQWNLEELQIFCPGLTYTTDGSDYANKCKRIEQVGVLSGRYVASGNPGDWLVKNTDNRFAFQEDLDFRAAFRPVEE